jgi:cytochrome c-type biogenesis protein CcmE
VTDTSTTPLPTVDARRRSKRLRYVIVGLLCIGAVVWMITLMQRNVIFFKTVSQAVHDRPHDGTHSLRIGGAVVPGTIHQTSNGATFELTQGHVTVAVVHTGTEPGLFKDCAPVVAEGHWDGATFTSGRLLIKHGSEYKPPTRGAIKCPPDPFGR